MKNYENAGILDLYRNLPIDEFEELVMGGVKATDLKIAYDDLIPPQGTPYVKRVRRLDEAEIDHNNRNNGLWRRVEQQLA